MSDDKDLENSFGPLDAGLRAGFGGADSRSVLAELERRTDSLLRLALPDVDADRDPVVKPVGPDGASALGARYQVVGEIARGGLGVVMKSRDLDLGRDVAIKVLHAEFQDDRAVIERFVEEAQIGGQLQHPGIVPVYELGLRADDRPFFTMKLVKGDTLAALLKRRRAPRDDQQRFLRIFLQVCQTVAYAHVRRVVHRDLKPSNVLIGAFGEVQVVDWGLAKVLRAGGTADEPARPRDVSVIATVRSAEGSSHSVAGSVMGTPAYMPPEQARGEVERMDARSDVFSLGAVLVEILSGAPLYDSDDAQERLEAAAEGRTGPTLDRLARAGVDEELVQLARACLAPAPDARPDDAGVVAGRVEAYLQAVDDRALRAEVRAAEVRVRARAGLALAALIAVGGALSSVLWIAWQGERDERRLDTERRASAAMLEAQHYAGQAEQAGLAGVELWAAAVGAARRADEVVAAGEARPDLAAEVAGLVADMEQEEARTRSQALREQSHEVLLERLLEVRVGPDVPRMDVFQGPARRARESSRRAVEYARLFGTIDVVDTTPPDRVAERLDCAHRADFARALDAWAEARRVAALSTDDPDPESWRRLIRAARRLDPEDPWRNTLRDELGQEELDPQALRALATPRAVRERSAAEVAVVVALLEAAGDLQGAVDTQIEGMLAHPSDYWLNVSFVALCSQEELTGRLHHDAASWGARTAVVLRPKSHAARFQMALTLGDETGVEMLGELLREEPDDPVLQSFHFWLLMNLGRFQEAAALLPGVLPALRAFGIDRDYAPFLWTFGYRESGLEDAGTSPLPQGLHLVGLDRYEEAWEILSGLRGQLSRTRSWPWLYLPPALGDVGSAEELRARVEHLRGLGTADEATLRATPVEDLLAATDLCEPAVGTRLFRCAFQVDPSSKEVGHLVRARQIAAFTAAAATGMAAFGSGPTPDECIELRADALAWMNEELDLIERDLKSPDLTREQATHYSRNLHQMTEYGYLAPIREKAYLAAMPSEQAGACRLLWARIAGLEAMLEHLASDGS